MATNPIVKQQDYLPFRLPGLPWGIYIRWFGMFIALVFIMWLGARIDDSPRRFVQETVNGVLVGGIYSLVAVGIVMINKATGIFNFAHGAMMLFSALVFFHFFTTPADGHNIIVIALFAIITVGAFIGMNSLNDLRNPRNLAIGAVVAALLTVGMTMGGGDLRMIRALIGGLTMAVLLGILIERFTIRPLLGQPIFTLILMTLALDAILRGISIMTWGSIEKKLTIFSGIDQIGIDPVIRTDISFMLPEGERLTNLTIDGSILVGFALALLIFFAFVMFFQYTSIGLAMRATSENQTLAQSVGLRVRAILAISWAIAALLALAAGVLYGGSTDISVGMPLLAIQAFPAVLLGGLESIGGALAGGIVIGLAQTWANLLFSNDAGTQLAPYVILMIVLIVRPDGLFGQKRIERI